MNKNIAAKQRINKKYSPQFKDQALERSAKDGIPQAANDLGVSESLLYSWRAKRQQRGDSIENQKLQQAEMARLRRENVRLQEEYAFLKKVATYVAYYQSQVAITMTGEIVLCHRKPGKMLRWQLKLKIFLIKKNPELVLSVLQND